MKPQGIRAFIDRALIVAAAAVMACSAPPPVTPADAACEGCCDPDEVCLDSIRINEVMSSNDGAWIDELGETDDWIELVNVGTSAVWLDSFWIGTDSDERNPLPARLLAPGEVLLVWADGAPEQGEVHLPFKLSARGEPVYLWRMDGQLVDRFQLPASEPNDSFARMPDGSGDLVRCVWPTPSRANGAGCGPLPPTELTNDTFAPFSWPSPWPAIPAPLALSELALRPAGFIEVANTSSSPVALSAFVITLNALAPGVPWPTEAMGVSLAWPVATLAPGERIAVAIDASATAAIAANPEFEGVVTLWSRGNPTAVDRVDFMWWPDQAILTRAEPSGQLRFCAASTPGAPNTACDPLASRPVGDRLHHLYTPGDFAALADGGAALGIDAVKVVIDMEAGDVVHLLSARAWALHYNFVREKIDGQPRLDRCDPTENALFRQGWALFSQRQYYEIETRRYLLGTLQHHTGAGIKTFEFATGDRIIAPQMLRAFFAAAERTTSPAEWSLRPQSEQQVTQMRLIEGQVPIVGTNTPFIGVTFQPLNTGVAFGVLRFVKADALDETPLGRQFVVVTDQVPNDIAVVGGLITESLQTPLAHVNVLSRNRGSPNMTLRDARQDPRIAPLFDQLVRFEVKSSGFELRAATASEAEAFWASQVPTGPPLVPRLDTSVRGVVELTGRSLLDLPIVGAKAAGLAELRRVNSTRTACPGPLALPANPAAIALVHSLEHYTASGAQAMLAAARADPTFRSDPLVRAARLTQIRAAILAHPVDATLLAEVEAYVLARFATTRVRFRSSSNTEDLPGFGGAGLYSSIGTSLGNPELSIASAIRTVWASLYYLRAYDERTLFNVDESTTAMAVLIHGAFESEAANGVGITRSVAEPIRSDHYTLNLQRGEASVVAPAPGVSTEQLIYRWGRTPRFVYHARSNLPASVPVMSDPEIDETVCVMRAIHDHFLPLLDPAGDNRWFAMDIEFKRVHGSRALAVKQARQYNFGASDVPADCREF